MTGDDVPVIDVVYPEVPRQDRDRLLLCPLLSFRGPLRHGLAGQSYAALQASGCC